METPSSIQRSRMRSRMTRSAAASSTRVLTPHASRGSSTVNVSTDASAAANSISAVRYTSPDGDGSTCASAFHSQSVRKQYTPALTSRMAAASASASRSSITAVTRPLASRATLPIPLAARASGAIAVSIATAAPDAARFLDRAARVSGLTSGASAFITSRSPKPDTASDARRRASPVPSGLGW